MLRPLVRPGEVRSLPFRLISRTFLPSRRAMTRKPSCLISCIQSGPVGGVLARLGRQGSSEAVGKRGRKNGIQTT